MPCLPGSGKSKRIRVEFIALILLVLMALPLWLSAWGALAAAWHPEGWKDLAADPQTPQALAMTLWTGVMSSTLALGLCALLLQWSFPGRGWPALVRILSPLLAVPHAAFAIGLAFLIAPSGWLLRLLSPWATGLQAPPPWPTTQDPWGLGLVAVLVAKEVPFLLWAAATELQRPDVAQRLTLELQVARSLGYSAQQAWWCVVWPQLLPGLRWPMLAVLLYSLTVVDMALVIGPSSPPTLSVLAWQWLQDADAARNIQGAVAGWLLAGGVLLLTSLAWWRSKRSIWQAHRTSGWRGQNGTQPKRQPLQHPATDALAKPTRSGQSSLSSQSVQAYRHQPWLGAWRKKGSLLVLLPPYLLVMGALALGSVAGLWPFPDLWPQTLTLQAWQSVARSASTLWSTLSLAASSAAIALFWSVA